MRTSELRISLLLLALVFLLALPVQAATETKAPASPAIAESPLQPVRELVVLAGTSRILTFSFVQRVAVANPAVADVVVTSQQEVLVNGMAPGVTTLHVWLKSERLTYNVTVASDFTTALDDLRKLLAEPSVTVSVEKETLLLTGTVPTQERKDRAVKVAQVFADKVVDLLTVAASDATQVIAQAIHDPNISINLHGDTVILEGRVVSENAKKRAEEIARAFAGKVVSLVEVDASAQPVIDTAAAVTSMVANPGVSARMVGQTLFLEGEVSSQLDLQRAEQIARALNSNVVNLIQVAQVQVIRGTAVSATTTVVSSQETISATPTN